MDSSLRAGNQKIQVFAAGDKPYGLSYGQWTVRWWRWAFSAPVSINPVLDNNGEYASVNQAGPVWFLAGTFGENRVPIRKCTIPLGKSILFPVINYEMNPLENPSLQRETELVQHVIHDIDDIVHTEAVVDGENVPIYRIQSDPPTFPLVINNDNDMGLAGGRTLTAADGYWVFLKPLSEGEHGVYFHGSCSGGIRNSTAKYHLTVVNQTF